MPTNAAIQKKALDESAKKYWSDYFGDYGRLWGKDIPLKVKDRMANNLSAQTSSKVELVGEITSLTHVVTADDARMEGVFQGIARVGDVQKSVVRMFGAAFTPQGQITRYQDHDITHLCSVDRA